MKNKGRVFEAVLNHVTVSLALAVGVLVILEIFNPRMGFLSSTYSRIVIALLAACALIVAIRSVRRDRRAQLRRIQREENARRSR